MQNSCVFLLGRPERTLGEVRRRWEDNIQVYFREIKCEDVNWIDSSE
jgi:hypothetical protein